LPTKIKLPLW